MRSMKKLIPLLISIITTAILLAGVVRYGKATPVSAIEVDTFDDELNIDGDCSLREAIEAANTNYVVDGCVAGSADEIDTIILEAGTYRLVIPGDDDINQTGDLDILGSVNIHGDGLDTTIVDGGWIDRVFHLYQSSIEVSMSNVTIQNGQSITGTGGSGIMVNPDIDLNINNCRIRNNTSSDFLGGGIENYNAKVTITNCTIEENSALEGGGIYNDGELYVFNSLIDSNSATGSGGGIKNSYSSFGDGIATLENVTISRNGSSLGSGIYSSTAITITNVTVVNNIGGMGIVNQGKAIFKNSLIGFHPDADNCSGIGIFASLGNNLDDGNSCHFDPAGKQDQINTDPLLVGDSPQDNGGMTYTYALRTFSPAIDAGTSTGCPVTDQRGFPRPKDGDGDGVAVCDIGAFEANDLVVLYFPMIFK
jgi:CSLREA domain-containing protein